VGYSAELYMGPTLSFQEKKSFFLQSRQTFGSTALVLQGGSVFGLCHVGVVRGLWKRGLLPRILVGWGVGGLIASLGIIPRNSVLIGVCSKTDAEMDSLLEPGGVDLSPLSHSEQGTRLRRLKRLFTEGHLFDVKYISFYLI
jgi:TAG lipase / lysophosphatidylethanolamine acyltransferase